MRNPNGSDEVGDILPFHSFAVPKKKGSRYSKPCIQLCNNMQQLEIVVTAKESNVF